MISDIREITGDVWSSIVKASGKTLYSATCSTHGAFTSNAVSPDQLQCPHCRKQAEAIDMPVETPEQRVHRILEHLSAEGGVPQKFRGVRICDFTPRDDAEKTAQDLAQGIYKGALGSLVILGRKGVGKTHLGCGIVNDSLLAGIAARYVMLSDLVLEVKDSWSKNAWESERQILARYAGYRKLVIDEVAASALTGFQSELLFSIVNSRYINEVSTVLIGNLTPEEFKGVDDRVRDRIKETGKVVWLPGESRRTQWKA